MRAMTTRSPIVGYADGCMGRAMRWHPSDFILNMRLLHLSVICMIVASVRSICVDSVRHLRAIAAQGDLSDSRCWI